MAERQTVPVLPIPGTVLFPGYPMTFAVVRSGSLKALEAASRGDRRIFVVAQRESSEAPQPESLYTVGVLALLGPVQMGHGALQVVISGEQRAAAIDYLPGDFLRAVVVPIQQLPPRAPDDPAFQALYRPLANEPDLEDVPEEVRRALRFHPVPTLSEVLAIALCPAEPASGAEARDTKPPDGTSDPARLEA